jgi:hypothetical protein
METEDLAVDQTRVDLRQLRVLLGDPPIDWSVVRGPVVGRQHHLRLRGGDGSGGGL